MKTNLFNIILFIFFGVIYIYINNEYPTIIVKYPTIDEKNINKNNKILVIEEL